MNRRQLIVAATLPSLLAPISGAQAVDSDVLASPIVSLLGMIPDRPGEEELDFPVTFATNDLLLREVLEENAWIGWFSEVDDLVGLLDVDSADITLTALQDTAAIWQLDNTRFDWEKSYASLLTEGWTEVDAELHLLQVAEGDQSMEGDRGWIAFPDVANVVMGWDEDHVAGIADRVKNHSAVATIDTRFHQLKYALRTDTYAMALYPPQKFAVSGIDAAFLSRSLKDEQAILQSIGFSLESADSGEELVGEIQDRMATVRSTKLDVPYGDFLTIEEVAAHGNTVRIDLVDTFGDWDIFRAVQEGDLLFLPIPRRYNDYPSNN